MNTEGIFVPPSGLSFREQARWWTSNPMMLQIAMINGTLPAGMWEEIIDVAKRVDLAYKALDRKKAPGHSEEERAMVFNSLTDGGIYAPSNKQRGRRPKIEQALQVAKATEGLSGREANRAARLAAGDTYHGNTVKLKAKAKAAKAANDVLEDQKARLYAAVNAGFDACEDDDERAAFVKFTEAVAVNVEGDLDLLADLIKGYVEDTMKYEM